MTTRVLLQAEQLSHLIENCFVKALTQLQSRLSSFRKTGTEMKAVWIFKVVVVLKKMNFLKAKANFPPATPYHMLHL